MLERFGRVRYFLEKRGGKKLTFSFFSEKNSHKKLSQTVVAALDMPLPEDYIRRLAPPPRSDAAPRCAVTGEPAKYRDPVTGAPFANVEAFKILRARGVGVPAKAANVAGEFFHFIPKNPKTRSLCTEAPGFFYS